MVKTKKNKNKIESPSVLYSEYDWFKKLFPIALQKSADSYFLPGLRCELIGVSKNINLLQTKDAYFVTKVRLDKFYDMYLRISDAAISILLDKGLGKAGRPFNVNKVSELEQAVLTGFNDYVYKIILQFLDPPPVVNFVRTNFDMTHVTFSIIDEERGISGRFIVSLPDGRLSPQKVVIGEDKFDYPDFYECNTEAYLKIGKTRFTVKDLKGLEVGDLIVLEDSNISSLTLRIKDEEKEVLVEPNMEIELPFDENNGGIGMDNNSTPNNLWDSIEVDMYAELDPVKITLGNLKKIEQGLVVDIAALYENKITLRVENKVIGHGELVIVNDRYGVKISDIEAKQQNKPVDFSNVPAAQDTSDDAENFEQNEGENSEYNESSDVGENFEEEGEVSEGDAAAGEDEFDYSDFELEDEDI